MLLKLHPIITMSTHPDRKRANPSLNPIENPGLAPDIEWESDSKPLKIKKVYEEMSSESSSTLEIEQEQRLPGQTSKPSGVEEP